jgi:3-oxoacyl-[acyl-carrier-protein] synthase II
VTIVVTGLGAITALGATASETWARVVRGERGLGELTVFEAEGYRSRIVGEVHGIPHEGDPGYARNAGFSRTSELALRAAREALVQAGLSRDAGRDARDGHGLRVGLVMGGTTAGMLETERLLAVLLSPEGSVDPAVREQALRDMLTHPLSAPTDRVAKELGPFSRTRSVSSACSGGANAILVGATWLELGLCDAVLCGAADALCRITLSGFNALASLDPTGARPFDKRRRGLTLGEGAGFVVLERAEVAARREQRAICTLLGWAARSEAHHITNPEPTGDAPFRAMQAALQKAGLGPADVDYVNAHGTGTPLNDPMEARAIGRVLGEHVRRVPVSSQKGQIGHTLAAAGAIEAALTALAIADGTIPPTGGLEEPDPECDVVHVRSALKRPIRAAVSSSFGFGGMDTVLVFGPPGAEAPAPRPSRGVLITGVATLTPTGLAVGRDVAAVPEQRDGDTVSVEGHLDASLARRLDRSSRMATIVCKAALGEAPRDAGIVLGSAFGAVDNSAAFMRRLQERGPRFAPPADFPGLVPSSPAGHASIYLGLGGPAMVVADLAASGECAIAMAYELVASGAADRLAAVAVEERSAIVEQVLAVLFGEGGDEARREGAAALALAPAEDGQPALARIDQVVSWASDPAVDLGVPPPGAIVVIGSQAGHAAEIVSGSAWASCPRFVCEDACGEHEAIGGIAVAVAAAKIARGEATAALSVGTARGAGYAITLRPCAST